MNHIIHGLFSRFQGEGSGEGRPSPAGGPGYHPQDFFIQIYHVTLHFFCGYFQSTVSCPGTAFSEELHYVRHLTYNFENLIMLKTW